MNANDPTLTVPLRTDAHGAIRIGQTRVTLDTLINFYLQGESPEDLHAGFPTIPLPDIYAVIAYFLANRAEVDVYLQQRQAEADRIQREIEAQYPPKVTRAELQARLEAKQDNEGEG